MGQALENVRRLYLDGIAEGNARDVVTKYTGHRYTQHSTGVGHGVEGFPNIFEPLVERNPNRQIRIVHDMQDGPWVFCSAYQSLNDGETQWVTMDLFHTDPDGLILEHWDTIAPYIAVTESGEDMVGGTSEIDFSADTSASKEIVWEYTKQILLERNLDQIDRFIAENLIQHGPFIAAGRDGLARWLADGSFGNYEMLFNLIGQGDLVVTFGKRHVLAKDIAVFDVYRVAGLKIVEHWNNTEEISPRAAWGNSAKF